MRKGYLSHRRPTKAQVSLRISAVSPEPLLFTGVVETLKKHHPEGLLLSTHNVSFHREAIKVFSWISLLPRAVDTVVDCGCLEILDL